MTPNPSETWLWQAREGVTQPHFVTSELPGPNRHRLTTCSRQDTRWLVVEVRRTEVFAQWLDGLADMRARARVQARIERLAMGNAGDVKPVGEGVSELRIDYGPGYRVYFTKVEREIVILLAGGDKRTQDEDIKVALRLARNL